MAIEVGTTPEERAKIAEALTKNLNRENDLERMNLAVLTSGVQMPGLEKAHFMAKDCQVAQTQAAITWIHIAKAMGLELGQKVGLQLACNLPGPDDYIDQTKMMDPVACHAWLRTFKGKNGAGIDLPDDIAREILNACGKDVQIHSLGAFLNLLHPDEGTRKQVHGHTIRVADAALKLKVDNITGFIGRNPLVSDDENLVLFEKQVIPLLKELKEMGIKKFRVEPCPMTGWEIDDNPIKNIAYNGPMWVKLFNICEKHGLADMLRITYDESHSIYMGQDHYDVFHGLQEAGFGFLIDEFHGKGLNKLLAKLAAYGEWGQKFGLGIRDAEGQPIDGAEGAAWGRYTGDHMLPGLESHNPLATAMKKMANWPAHQYHARKTLGLKPADTIWILEHEFNKQVVVADGKESPSLRVQNVDLVIAALTHSLGYIAAVDEAADRQIKLRQHLERNGVYTPGPGEFAGLGQYNEVPGLKDEIMAANGGEKYYKVG